MMDFVFMVQGCLIHHWATFVYIFSVETRNNPLRDSDFQDIVKPQCLHQSPEKTPDRFKKFTDHEIVARDEANLDIFWLKDESLEDTEYLPPQRSWRGKSSRVSRSVVGRLRRQVGIGCAGFDRWFLLQ